MPARTKLPSRKTGDGDPPSGPPPSDPGPDARDVLLGLLKGELTFGAWLGVSADDLRKLVELADGKMAMGRHHEARRIFEGLTALEPEVAGFHLGVGIACEAEGDVDHAFDAYTRAIHLLSDDEDPSLCAAYMGRGGVRIRRGDDAGALVDLALAREHGGDADPTLRDLLAGMTARCAERFAKEAD